MRYVTVRRGPGGANVSCVRRWLSCLVVCVFVMLAACQGCRGTHTPAEAASADRSAVRLYLISDFAGALEPCGCVKDQLGGTDHFGALVEKDKPTVKAQGVLTAGPLFFLDMELRADALSQETAKAQTIAEASNAMAKQNSKLTRGYSMKVFNRELPKLTETMARLYADNFSVEEMKSLIDFYTSPKGRLMIDFSRAMSGGTPSKADFNEADGKAGMQAGVEFQASTLGKLYAERLQKIQAQAGEIIETVHKKARAAGADR